MLARNYFEMFGLPPRFSIDLGGLEQLFHRLQAELHPDRHAGGTETERRMALQHSTMLNDGYRTLRHPASRAQCLLILAGRDETQSQVSSSFLTAQMEWREAIAEARVASDVTALEALARRLRHKLAVQEKDLADALDSRGDFEAAGQRINEFRFYEKLRAEIDDALDQLEV